MDCKLQSVTSQNELMQFFMLLWNSGGKLDRSINMYLERVEETTLGNFILRNDPD